MSSILFRSRCPICGRGSASTIFRLIGPKKNKMYILSLCQIFDKKNNAVNAIFHFVEEAMEQGECCLIHSVNGKSRATAVTVAYLMKKYSWSLKKCLEFISSKKEKLDIRNNYLAQLTELESRMAQIYNLSSEWSKSKNIEELLLANTYQNSSKPTEDMKADIKNEKKTAKRVNWDDKPTIHKMGASKPLKEQVSTSKNKFQPKSILKGCEDQ